MKIVLEFAGFELKAELFKTKTADAIARALPLKADLEKWGNELYGSIGLPLPAEKPVPEIPEGGLAYSTNGAYLCIFFGQKPAWPVEYIGRIEGETWKKLLSANPRNVIIKKLM
jgi:uncharacterized protein